MKDRLEVDRSKQVAMMVLTALMTGILCVTGPISIPIGPVPISIGVLVLFLTVYVLGTKYATIACVLYLILGLAGLPVFAGHQGGLSKLAGPTGGYLIGYIPMVIIAGVIIDITKKNRDNRINEASGAADAVAPAGNDRLKKGLIKAIIQGAGMLLAVVVLYAFGTAWFVISTGTPVGAALSLCVIPFIPADLIKIVIAAILGPTLAGITKRINSQA